MGLLTVIPQGNIGGIAIDATLEEVLEDTLQVTEHPVEAGAMITDHSFVRPCEVVLRCGWSNASAAALLGNLTSLLSSGSLSASDYVTGVYSQLLALQQAREPVTVVTSLRQYENMMLTSVRVTRDSKTSQALMMVATLREVILVSTFTTTLPPTANQANPASTAENVNVGTTAPVPATPAPGGAVPPEAWAS
jgi:hypothetical protein